MTGSDVLKLGILEGPEVGQALRMADSMGQAGFTDVEIEKMLKDTFKFQKIPLLTAQEPPPFMPRWSVPNSTNGIETLNNHRVFNNMREMCTIPVVKDAAVMPDACPAGPGITVGGVIEVENAIIPSAHSADICCSMHTSFFECNQDAKEILDTVGAVTVFGPGGRPNPLYVDFRFGSNPFLRGLENTARTHLGTQGDGNHFASLGRFTVSQEFKEMVGDNNRLDFSAPTAELVAGRTMWALTTHHGSRGFGAEVFKRGQKAAEKYTNKVATGIPKYAAWLSMETSEGKLYWEALETILAWTMQNHRVIHNNVLARLFARNVTTIFNEHNFVWRKESEAPWDTPIYVHGKGATPAQEGALGIIPLNMSEPILIVAGTGNRFLDFAPHGAGRNESRTAVSKRYEHLGDSRGISPRDAEAIVAEQTKGLDIRWYNGKPDITESPLAYKSASYIRDAIKTFQLATIIGEIQPAGSIMAGFSDPFWKRKKDGKKDGNFRVSAEAEEETGGKEEGETHEEVYQGIPERSDGEAFNRTE